MNTFRLISTAILTPYGEMKTFRRNQSDKTTKANTCLNHLSVPAADLALLLTCSSLHSQEVIATWNVGGNLTVGNSTVGNMTISTKGTVSNTVGHIGTVGSLNGTAHARFRYYRASSRKINLRSRIKRVPAAGRHRQHRSNNADRHQPGSGFGAEIHRSSFPIHKRSTPTERRGPPLLRSNGVGVSPEKRTKAGLMEAHSSNGNFRESSSTCNLPRAGENTPFKSSCGELLPSINESSCSTLQNTGVGEIGQAHGTKNMELGGLGTRGSGIKKDSGTFQVAFALTWSEHCKSDLRSVKL